VLHRNPGGGAAPFAGGVVLVPRGAGETRSTPYWAHAGAEPSGAAQGLGWADATTAVVPPSQV